MTGLWRTPQLAETLELALRLHPTTKLVTVVDMIPNNSRVQQKQINDYVAQNRPELRVRWLDHESFDDPVQTHLGSDSRSRTEQGQECDVTSFRTAESQGASR